METLANRMRAEVSNVMSQQVNNFVFKQAEAPCCLAHLCVMALPVESFLNRVFITVACSFTLSHSRTISPAATKCSTSRSAITCSLRSSNTRTVKNRFLQNKIFVSALSTQQTDSIFIMIYYCSTHLSDLSFALTFAYKTSTIAGSSFMYSVPFTSNGRGFASVRSLVGGNKRQIAVTHMADQV